MLKYRRVMAFLLDALFISIIVIALSSNPRLNKGLDNEEAYLSAYNESINNLVIDQTNPEDIINQYKEGIGVQLYDMIKSQTYRYVIFIICVFLYYVVFVYFNDGKTLGCALFKLRINNMNGSKANILNLTVRSLFMGSSFIYLIPIVSFINLIIPRLYNYQIAFFPLLIITSVSVLIEIVFYIYFFFSKKNMSIQDYLSHTKIIDTSK